ncbi:hypothetical protein Fleli_3166 [Bernardetia litoralis DSM 6794]|uniref:Lipoprotein n=1 Tax=Bernardetia litoralis (strain ATCC 23117 / DSM 6794 / NBRC 15988 / NCIMB 1366 / Fx l1 / Sio-4) TaxID=880071 RepID=I4ANG6_BERLS|nr:hypothetical protein [Bernardetia litoralis]AFM05501.1 hypothetical protein Fleli_3166 [Bernardetia litoralis DSM 6794]
MKNILFITLLLFIVSSCDLIDAVDGCDTPEKMELTENDQKWIPKDSIQYFAVNNDTFNLPSYSFSVDYLYDTKIDCRIPIVYSKSLATKYIPNANITIYIGITREANYANISYNFSKNTNTQIVGRSQLMGTIDLDRNLPIPMEDSYSIHSEYLGNYTIRGREYTEVYKFTDLDESNVPEIDVSSIIVSPLGFLRIEFYDGEVWERIIIE